MPYAYAQMNTSSCAADECSGWFTAAMTGTSLPAADIALAMSVIFFPVGLGVRLCLGALLLVRVLDVLTKTQYRKG